MCFNTKCVLQISYYWFSRKSKYIRTKTGHTVLVKLLRPVTWFRIWEGWGLSCGSKRDEGWGVMVVISGHVGSSNLIPDCSIFISRLLSHWFQWPDGRRERHTTAIIWYMWAPVAFPLNLPGLSLAICTTGQALCSATPSSSPWSSLLRFHIIITDVSQKILHVTFYVPFWHLVIGFLTANHHVQNVERLQL